jgi:benzoyl-CoA reductase/2-hydroxyglutaryl-CoA dehydratase subunit BcrC/BadD/HgdB
MKKILYTSPFVPAEWISAYGLQPVRLYPSLNGEVPAVEQLPGLCPYARMMAHACLQGTDAAAVVIAGTCDQMRRAAELIFLRSSLEVFLMHVPSTWHTVTAFNLYCYELKRLGEFLEECGGAVPSEKLLADKMLQCDSERGMLRDLQGTLPARQYADMVMQWFETRSLHMPEFTGSSFAGGTPVIMTGGPLMKEHLVVYNVIEEHGGMVCFDATENGELLLPAPYDRRVVRDEPFMEMASAFFGSIPGVFQRPNSRLYDLLKQYIDTYSPAGILLVRYVWCDLWHAEVQRMKEWLSLPLLEIELNDETPGIDTRTKTRIQAFLETLSAPKGHHNTTRGSALGPTGCSRRN